MREQTVAPGGRASAGAGLAAVRLSWSRALTYAFAAAPLAATAFALQVLLPPFYADTVGLGLEVTAAVLVVARLWDIGSDLLIGTLADRFSFPPGKRKFWILLGTPITIIAALMLFTPPAGAGAAYLAMWVIALYGGGTLIIVPYNAWGADLAVSYQDRTRITAWRTASGMSGVILLLVGLAAASASAGLEAPHLMDKFALVVAPIILGGTLLAVFILPDRRGSPRCHAPAGDKASYQASEPAVRSRLFIDILRPHATRNFFIAFVINGLANGIPAALFVLFVTFVLRRPDLVGLFSLLYFGFALLSAPAWVLVARRVRKDRLWRVSLLFVCVIFAVVPFLGASDAALFAVVCALTGIAFGADLILPGSITSDLARRDEMRMGRERAAGFFAILGSLTKAGAALGLGIAFMAVGQLGFDTRVAGAPIWGISVVYGTLPIFLKLMVCALLARDPPPQAA